MGSEMCIRDSHGDGLFPLHAVGRRALLADGGREAGKAAAVVVGVCLLYTSDAADERSSVDLGGRRIIKKKKERSVGGCNRRLNNR